MTSSLLSRERVTAPADRNRWLVPPAALAIHLSIGAVIVTVLLVVAFVCNELIRVPTPPGEAAGAARGARTAAVR